MTAIGNVDVRIRVAHSNTNQTLLVPRCEICGKVCRTWQGLSSHDRHKHDDGGCPICEGGFGQACWWHFL